MSLEKRKRTQLKKLKLKKYKIYGIFDFKADKLVYVTMDADNAEMELELGDYDPENYDIVCFEICLR